MRVITRRYMHLSIMIQNMRTVLSTFVTLFLALHMFASVWIYLGCLDDGWYLSEKMVPAYDEKISMELRSILQSTSEAVK